MHHDNASENSDNGLLGVRYIWHPKLTVSPQIYLTLSIWSLCDVCHSLVILVQARSLKPNCHLNGLTKWEMSPQTPEELSQNVCFITSVILN